MAKRYGGRWETIADAWLGGQVFRVRDASGELKEEFALKRVPDIKRRERFKREIEAIKRLTDRDTQAVHPNIISLIDHSALEDTADAEKQFLVMPIAQGGDLSGPGRLALYRDSIDSVLQVARQLASALGAAHQAGIIHRDVKPKNILFTGNGHETWLSDFGICLIREAPRITETPEVMGPRAFMAPELEDGGQLDVTPAADIYSLGKVIYFMLSGGVTVPRERLHEPQFSAIFATGQRYQLLEMLLRRMICPKEQRIQTAADVISELKKIEDGEKSAQLLPMSQDTLAMVQQLQRRSHEKAKIVEEDRQARRLEAETQGAIQLSVTAWLRAELQKVAETVTSEAMVCKVQDAGIPDSFRAHTGHTSMYSPLNGVELVVEDVNDQFNRTQSLQFFLCTHGRAVSIVHTGPGSPMPSSTPARDIEFAIVPTYCRMMGHRAPSLGYISRQGQIGQTRGRLQMPRPGHRFPARNQRLSVVHYRVARIEHTFDPEVSVHEAFRASEWPGNEASLRAMLQEALGGFFAHISAS